MSVRVSKDNFDIEVLLCNNIIVADFYSDSCVPCKRLSPVLAELEEEYPDNVKFVKINVNFDVENMAFSRHRHLYFLRTGKNRHAIQV